MAASKRCRRCKETKALTTEFFPHNKHSKDAFDGMCKACWKLRSAERSKAGPSRAGVRIVKERLASSKKAYKQVQRQEGEAADDRPRGDPLRFHPKGPEPTPRGVQVTALRRSADLPGGGVVFQMYAGETLEQHVRSFRERYGQDAKVVAFTHDPPYFPRVYYLRVPDEFQHPTGPSVEGAARPASKGGKRVRS